MEKLVFLIFLFFYSTVLAQDKTIENDTLKTNKTDFLKLQKDSLNSNKKRIGKVMYAKMTKSPNTALYLSIIPGLGQFYNESYIKSAVIFTASASIIMIMYNRQINFDRMQSTIIDYQKENSIPDDQTDATLTRYRQIREVYRDDRDLWGFYLIGVYIVSAIDAYVGASLFDFQVNDNISMNFRPNFKNYGLSVNIDF